MVTFLSEPHFNLPMQFVQEGSAKIRVQKVSVVSKSMGVFYNPVMQLNRDLTIAVLEAVPQTHLSIADPLAGTGIRAIRLLKELPGSKIKSIAINDYGPDAARAIRKNFALNKISLGKKAGISCLDANIFLLNSFGFDYIDIDPFGTPNPYLDAAIKRLSRDGILAVTATDTAALAGTFPEACLRKYWAMPQRGSLQHEIGLRILIRKVQLIGAQYEKALIPIFSYSKEHYLRAFLQCTKGKKFVDGILRNHGTFRGAGPLWLGNLWDIPLVKKMGSLSQKKFSGEFTSFIRIIGKEASIPSVGFFDIHKVCEKLSLRAVPRTESILGAIRQKGHAAARTHFNDCGIRTSMAFEDFEKIVANLGKGRE